ncbi:MAG TPA: hypothetical protein VJC39_04835 [Candidatus Nanoarchaeia archaeon]|nr:hypothetical protein [Candidatus Nanoarchaeia archaeon]
MILVASGLSVLAVGPTISNLDHSPEFPTTEDEVSICAKVIDAAGLSSVKLKWNNGVDGTVISSMNNTLGDNYCRSLSYLTLNAVDGMTVTYSVIAKNINNEETISPTQSYTYDGADPNANAGGPYTCAGGDTITLDGLNSDDSVDDNLDFAWDLDNDGQFDDSSSSQPEFDCINGQTSATVSVKVTDNVNQTDTDSSEITINYVNQKPKIEGLKVNGKKISGLTGIVTGVKPNILILAADDSDSESDLNLNEQLSTVNGLSFNSVDWIEANGLEIDLMPGNPGEEYDLSLVVTDSEGLDSEAQEFSLYVKKGLEISQVEFNEEQWNSPESVAVVPGEKVTVFLSFTNNLEQELGLVEVSADVDSNFAEFPYLAECTVVDCKNGKWRLEAGETASHSFIFQVPFDAPEEFTLSLKVEDDGFWFWDDSYEDEKQMVFNVQREGAGVVITDLTLEDDQLSCGENLLDVKLDLVNIGENALTPGVLIYDVEAVLSSFNQNTGEFTKFQGTPKIVKKKELSELGVMESATEFVTVDVSALGQGQHKLYTYVINPHVEGEVKGLADYGSVDFNLNGCITSFSPAAESIYLPPGGWQEFLVSVADENLAINWHLNNGVSSVGSGTSYLFEAETTGDYSLEVVVGEESHSWAVHVPDFNHLLIENKYGSVEFLSPITNLAGITGASNLDTLILISEDSIAVNTELAPGLNQPAKITLIGTYTDPAIKKSTGFNQGVFVDCVDCKIISNSQSELVFTVEGFSTYQVSSVDSCLIIDHFEINGKSSGELVYENNDFEIEVKNDCGLDLEEVEVTVTLLDVDGEDLDESADEFDLDKGDQEKVTLEIDLAGEEIDEESYSVQVEVEARDGDGNQYKVTKSLTADLDLEKHDLIIESVDLGSSLLQCQQQTTLEVNIKNVGQNNEDEVELRVRSSDLGVDLKKENIELDKFSASDNDYRAEFSLYLDPESKVKNGKYKLQIELLRDGEVEDTEEIEVTVQDCLIILAVSGSTDKSSLQDQLEKELQQYKVKEGSSSTWVSTSFRQSDSYLLLLALLTVLVFIALVLALAIGLSKKRKKSKPKMEEVSKVLN